MLTVGSLFSGIGGFDLGLERAGMQVKWQVENNEYCRRVLQKHWPTVPRYGDITTIDWHWIPRVDLVCGGFPCQPFSVAGKRRGKDDNRYLWPEVVRCLDALRPTWFLGENVPGFVSLAQFTDEPPVDDTGTPLGAIGDIYHRMGRGIANEAMETLECLGYQVIPFAIPACAVDAPHIRQRIWILAHCSRELSYRSGARCTRGNQSANGGEFMAYAECKGSQRQRPECELRETKSEVQVGRRSRWLSEPELGRSSDGLPHWLDGHIGKGMTYAESQRAIKALRKLWKPDVAETIWRTVGGLDRISQAEVLFAFVREYKKDAHQARLLLASQEALETFVRGVRRTATASRASHRSKQGEQRAVEHSDSLQVVSQFSPCDTETPWPALGWEDGIPRVASGIKYRVDRLRGLGNAVVPQIVEALGRMILEAERQMAPP